MWRTQVVEVDDGTGGDKHMHGQCEANPLRIDGSVEHTWVLGKADPFGRSKEIKRILRCVRQGQSVSVVGPAQSGKSLLLDYLARDEVLNQHSICASEHVFLWVSGRAFADVDQATCLCGFCKEILTQFEQFDATLKARLAEEAASSELVGHRGLRTMFRIAQECGLKPVLVLDDFDDLAQNALLQDRFFAALRSLATGSEVVYLIASRQPLYELEKARPEASTLCGICQQLVLRPLPDPVDRAMGHTIGRVTV
jgi:hypothetical protein